MSDRLRGEEGFTLPELLVTISMSMIVMLAAFGLLDTTIKRTGETQGRVEATQRGRQALDQMTRQLRSQVCFSATTPAMVEAQPLSATFYVDHHKDPSLPIHQRLEKRRLAYDPAKRQIVESTWTDSDPATSAITFTPAPNRTRVLLTNAAPGKAADGTTDAVFRYYKFSAATPPKPDAEVVNPGAADLGRIAQVDLNYWSLTGTPVGGVKPRGSLELRDQVFMRAADPNDPAPYPTCA